MIVKIVVPDSIYAQVYFARGEQGPQGPQGIQGASGATGAVGPTGPAGTNGTNGTNGVGYTGVTSTSSVPVAVGLHTWTVANVGAFLPGMRIRAIHTDTPSIWLEGPANVASGSTIIITADKVSGSGTHATWKFAVAGEIGPAGATGATGPSGVIAVTAPITNSGTSTSANIGLDLTNIAPIASPTFTGTVTLPLANTGLVTSTGSGVVGVTSAPPALGRLPYTASVTGGYDWFDLGLLARRNATNTFTGAQTVDGVINTNQYLNMTTSGNAGIAIGGFYRIRMTAGITEVLSGGATNPVLTAQGAASQSANLFELRNSAGSAVSFFTSAGRLVVGTDTSAMINATANAAGTIGVVIRGAASQTANLVEWQNSAGTVLASVLAAGNVRGVTVGTNNDVANLRESNSGGALRLTRSTTNGTPGANQVQLQILAGTVNGSRLVAIGPFGTPYTILDNIQ